MEDSAKVCMNTASVCGGSSVLRSASDTAITTAAEAWELSLAAASASKDKRVKDVKNTSLKQASSKKRQTKTSNDASVISVTDGKNSYETKQYVGNNTLLAVVTRLPGGLFPSMLIGLFALNCVFSDLIDTTIRVQVPGLEGFIPPSTTLAQLTAVVPHVFGPHLAFTLHLNTNGGTNILHIYIIT